MILHDTVDKWNLCPKKLFCYCKNEFFMKMENRLELRKANELDVFQCEKYADLEEIVLLLLMDFFGV